MNQENKNKDSQNILDAFTGKSKEGRKSLVLGQKGLTAFKQGDWILIPPHKGKKIVNKWVNIETGKSKAIQLYNIKEDINQQNNLAEAMPDKVAQMMADLAAATK